MDEKKKVVSNSVKEKCFLLSERKQGRGNNSWLEGRFFFYGTEVWDVTC